MGRVTHLGLVIPGGPFFLSAVLRVPAVALGELGVELRDVGLPPGFSPSGQLDDNREYFEAVGQQIQAIIDEGDWSEVTFVAKSVGTMILGSIGTALSVPSKVNAVWRRDGRALTRDLTRSRDSGPRAGSACTSSSRAMTDSRSGRPGWESGQRG